MRVDQRQKLMEAVKHLDEMEYKDPEIQHGEAEEILCKLLRDLGYGDASDAFDRAQERIGFWYA